MNSPAQRDARLRAVIDCDLLVLDDLFLARAIPDDAGTLLQTLIHQRYKLHRSVIVTSNRVVQDWGTYLMWWNGPLHQHQSARTWSLFERHKGGTVP